MPEDGFQSLREKGDAFLVIRPLPSLTPAESQDAPAESVKLRCHSTLLKLASPLLDDLLGSCCAAPPPEAGAGTAIELKVARGDLGKVDGPAGAWLDILTLLYSTFLPVPHTSSKRKASSASSSPADAAALVSAAPSFSWDNAAGMLPILHKYDMSSLLDRVVSWIGTQSMSGDARSPAYVLDWLDLSHTLQLDALADICTEQLNQLPLSLSPQHPAYVCTWLRLADERHLPALQARCLALLNTGAVDGGGSGLQLSLRPGSESYVMGLLSMVHTSGHYGELQPLRKKCMHSIRRAAEKGSLQEDSGGGGGAEQPALPGERHGGGAARSIVQELLHPPAAEEGAGAAAPGSGVETGAARLDGLSALAEGLLSRCAALDQMRGRLQGAREVYLCSNCGHGIAVFKPQAQQQRKVATWLRFVSSHSAPATLPCPVCGNASCTSQPNANECKVMWDL